MTLGADDVSSTSGAERSGAQALPGTATLTLSTLAHTGVVGGAVLRYIMEFTCLVVMQLYLSFWELAAVTAWGNHCSEASREDRAASKGVRPGSDSRFPNNIPDMNTMVSQKVIPGRSCGAAQAKPVKTKLYTAMVILWITCEKMPHIRTVTDLHKAVQEQARDNFNSADAGLNDSDVAGWAVVARAGGRWHELSVNETWGRQALPAPSGKRCFSCMWALWPMQSMAAGSIL